MPFGLELVLQILLAIHAARTGRTQPWLYIILFIPLIGPLLYVVVELGPEFFRGYAGQRMATGVVKTLAPERDYRALARQVEIAPPSITRCTWPTSACGSGGRRRRSGYIRPAPSACMRMIRRSASVLPARISRLETPLPPSPNWTRFAPARRRRGPRTGTCSMPRRWTRRA